MLSGDVLLFSFRALTSRFPGHAPSNFLLGDALQDSAYLEVDGYGSYI